MRKCLISSIALSLAAAAPASGAERLLEVPATASWKHAASGLILPPQLNGMTRTKISDLTDSELDVVISYEDSAAVTSVFVFRPAFGDAALWFDRKYTVVRSNPQWGITIDTTPEPVMIGSAATASGWQSVFPLTGGFSSTGLAMIQTGEWLVGIRMTSRTLDAVALSDRMRGVVAAIPWPAATPAPALSLIAPCPTSLKFKRARQLQPDMGQVLMASVLSISAGKKEGKPVSLCRDGAAKPLYSIYRAPDQKNSYLVAFADAGRGASVDQIPSLSGGRPVYMVNRLDLGSTAVLSTFDRLPDPEQLLAGLTAAPSATVGDGGKTITIGASATR